MLFEPILSIVDGPKVAGSTMVVNAAFECKHRTWSCISMTGNLFRVRVLVRGKISTTVFYTEFPAIIGPIALPDGSKRRNISLVSVPEKPRAWVSKCPKTLLRTVGTLSSRDPICSAIRKLENLPYRSSVLVSRCSVLLRSGAHLPFGVVS